MSKIKGYDSKNSQHDKKNDHLYPKGDAGLAYYDDQMNKNKIHFQDEDDKTVRRIKNLKNNLEQSLKDYEDMPDEDKDLANGN